MTNEEKIMEMLGKLTEKVDSMDQRMDRIEGRIDHLDERSQRTAVLMEADIAPKLQLLYEGHESIMEYLDKLVPKSRVELLESDMELVKHSIKLLRQEIKDLKKAQ